MSKMINDVLTKVDNLEGEVEGTQRIAISAIIYGGPDLTFRFFHLVDQREQSGLAEKFVGRKMATGNS
jgi:hypothetical protein